MKQNMNFNFKSETSSNEKILIVFSWIIIVIMIILFGLYYGQKSRELDTNVNIKSSNIKNELEISSNSNLQIEDGELTVKSNESVLTDKMTLNKNEVFAIQIGSLDNTNSLNEDVANNIINEYQSKGIYTKKVLVNPELSNYIVQVGNFKKYDEAKAFLNSIKFKNYPLEIVIITDPDIKLESKIITAENVSFNKNDELIQDSSFSKNPKNISEIQFNSEKTPSSKLILNSKQIDNNKNINNQPVVNTSQVEIKPSLEITDNLKNSINEDIENTKINEHVNNTNNKANSKEQVSSLKKEQKTKTQISKVDTNKQDKNNKIKDNIKTTEINDEEIFADEDIEIDNGNNNKFYLQLGTYKSSKNAENFKNKLINLGIKNVTIISGKLSSGETVYKVRVNGFDSKQSAQKEFEKIKPNFPDIKPYISKD